MISERTAVITAYDGEPYTDRDDRQNLDGGHGEHGQAAGNGP